MVLEQRRAEHQETTNMIHGHDLLKAVILYNASFWFWLHQNIVFLFLHPTPTLRAKGLVMSQQAVKVANVKNLLGQNIQPGSLFWFDSWPPTFVCFCLQRQVAGEVQMQPQDRAVNQIAMMLAIMGLSLSYYSAKQMTEKVQVQPAPWGDLTNVIAIKEEPKWREKVSQGGSVVFQDNTYLTTQSQSHTDTEFWDPFHHGWRFQGCVKIVIVFVLLLFVFFPLSVVRTWGEVMGRGRG